MADHMALQSSSRYATRLSRKGPRAPQVRALTQLGVALHATSNSAVAIPQLSHQCLIEAQKCLDEAVNLDPENASANFNLARVKVWRYCWISLKAI